MSLRLSSLSHGVRSRAAAAAFSTFLLAAPLVSCSSATFRSDESSVTAPQKSRRSHVSDNELVRMFNPVVDALNRKGLIRERLQNAFSEFERIVSSNTGSFVGPANFKFIVMFTAIGKLLSDVSEAYNPEFGQVISSRAASINRSYFCEFYGAETFPEALARFNEDGKRLDGIKAFSDSELRNIQQLGNTVSAFSINSGDPTWVKDAPYAVEKDFFHGLINALLDVCGDISETRLL